MINAWLLCYPPLARDSWLWKKQKMLKVQAEALKQDGLTSWRLGPSFTYSFCKTIKICIIRKKIEKIPVVENVGEGD